MSITARPFLRLTVCGLLIGFARYAFEWTVEPKDQLGNPLAMIGLYYVMPLVTIIAIWKQWIHEVFKKRLALKLFLVGFLVWSIPNSVAYTTAQLDGWNFGRYHYDIAWDEAQAAFQAAQDRGVYAPTPAKLLGREAPLHRSAPRGATVGQQVVNGVGVGALSGLLGGLTLMIFGVATHTLRWRQLMATSQSIVEEFEEIVSEIEEAAVSRYINTDLDLTCDRAFARVIRGLEQEMHALYYEKVKGGWCATLELNDEEGTFSEDPAIAIAKILDTIDSLGPQARSQWQGLQRRCLDIGWQSSDQRPEGRIDLPQPLLQRMHDHALDLRVTIYPSNEH